MSTMPKLHKLRAPTKAEVNGDLAIAKIVNMSSNPLAQALPRGDRVLVYRDKPQKETVSGLILVNVDKKATGRIVRVGPGRQLDNGERVPIDLAPGQRVLLAGFAGIELRNQVDISDADEFVILREDDIVALLD